MDQDPSTSKVNFKTALTHRWNKIVDRLIAKPTNEVNDEFRQRDVKGKAGGEQAVVQVVDDDVADTTEGEARNIDSKAEEAVKDNHWY